MYTLMLQIRDMNPKMLSTTFCERAIFINDTFMYICVLLALLVLFDDWSFELDLHDSHLIVLYIIILHLVFGLIAYFLGEILQTTWTIDGTRGGPFLLIILVSTDCSDELDHPVFFVLFMGLFIIFHRFLTPKTLAIYPKIKGIISDLLKFVRGENREEKPLADSDSTNSRTYQRECITKNILGLEDLQQHCCGRCDAAAKSFCAICDPGLHTTDSLTRKSFEVLENLMPWEQLRNAIDIDQARQIQTQMCRKLFDARGGHPIHVDTYFGWLRTHLCLNLCDSVCIHSIFGEQTIDFVHIVSVPEKKIVTIKTFKRTFRTMSASFEDHNRHCSSSCKGASLGGKRMQFMKFCL
ncbi:uncharacterized protein LOC131325779 [Rhododendron vialii]|uniref:uncharacterized protein LOC131325779 n=1 Tax=Rhododendron vialii TaxID=182163 RepID=UPI00265F7C46|nr:uncharacterized protein LOC131325779 [Rhododendron vialii]